MKLDRKYAAKNHAHRRGGVVRERLDGLARRYYRPLLSFFRKRVRSPAEVDDLVQQVFLRLAQHARLESLRDPDAYIFQTAANTLRDYWRRGLVRERFAVQALPNDTDFSAERVLLGEEAIVCLVAALRELPEKTRDVFVLRCFEGLKIAEIGKLLGISVRMVEKHLARALAHASHALE